MPADTFPVEAGHVMAFARAIGDFNPVYHDARAAAASEVGGIIAPPTFVQASAHFDDDYPLRPRPGVRWFGSGRFASGTAEADRDDGATKPASDRGTGLHAEQHYLYHRPIRAGEVLTLNVSPGATWEKQGRRGGLLTFREVTIDYVDKDGDVVVSARAVSVMTSQAVRD